jgi:hypothetical protein
MPVVLPGKPFAGLQAVSVAQWRDERFIVSNSPLLRRDRWFLQGTDV